MPKYQCPECEAILKREAAVEPGKKIKCPKCETIFKAKPMREMDEEEPEEEEVKKVKKKKAKAAPEKKKEGDDDSEEGGSYTVVEETAEKKKKLYFGSLRDKFAKSKRGPAMSMLVSPSNWIMAEGILICVGSILAVGVGFWPFIFSNEAMPRNEVMNQIIIVVCGVLGFVFGGFLCYTASCMHELRYYSLVWVGCIAATLPPLACLVVAIVFGFIRDFTWAYPMILMDTFVYGLMKAFKAISSEDVKDGFIETVEKANEIKNL